MIGEHRFLKIGDGTAFARITVDSEPNSEWQVVWTDQARGGQPQRVRVLSLVETADTRNDAVTCAAALAAWKSWGGNADDIEVIFAAAEWTVPT